MRESVSRIGPWENYTADGRKPPQELLDRFDELQGDGWKRHDICIQRVKYADGKFRELPVVAYTSPVTWSGTRESLFAIDNPHGEEPASGQAFYDNTKILVETAKQGIPVVFMPFNNPAGRDRGWRYFDAPGPRLLFPGHSTTDPDHVLPHKLFPFLPRRFKPSSEVAGAIINWVLEISKTYEPFLVVDHHEDKLQPSVFYHDWADFYTYLYVHDPDLMQSLCVVIHDILEQSGYQMQKGGKTRFGEKINALGIVENSDDGSMDYLFYTDRYIGPKGKVIYKKPATAVIVAETPIHHIHPLSLLERADVHAELMRRYAALFEMLHARQAQLNNIRR